MVGSTVVGLRPPLFEFICLFFLSFASAQIHASANKLASFSSDDASCVCDDTNTAWYRKGKTHPTHPPPKIFIYIYFFF